MAEMKPNPEDDTCRTGENALLWVSLVWGLLLVSASLLVVAWRWVLQ